MSRFFELPAGTKIDERYELLSLLGMGGLGSVYKANQSEIDRVVAIKLLHLSNLQEDEERFRREGIALSALKHTNIPQFYHFGLCQLPGFPTEVPYIAMEYLQGSTLRRELSKLTRLPWKRALHITRQIADAMDAAHSAGIIHRDLKPENIILVATPEPDTVKVCDFGLAKLAPATDASKQELKLTATGMIVGSVNYLSPEQCLGQLVDRRSDIYSLCCLLYEMLVGEVPFSADTPVGVIYKHINEKPITTAAQLKLPEGSAELLSKALAKNPQERHQSMRELISDLDLLLADKGAQIRREIGDEKKENKHRTTVIAGSGILLILGCSSLFFFQKSYSPAQTKKAASHSATKQRLKPLFLKSELENGTLEDAHRLLSMAQRARDLETERKLFRQALAIMEKVSKPTSQEYCQTLTLLASSCWRLGNYAEARQLLKRALDGIKKGDCEPIQKAEILYAIAQNLRPVRNHKDAIGALELALELQKGEENLSDIHMPQLYTELAHNYSETGKLDKAADYLKLSIESLRHVSIPENLVSEQVTNLKARDVDALMVNNYSALSDIYMRKRDYKQAKTCLDLALSMRLKSNDNNMIQACVGQIAHMYAVQHKYKEAEAILRKYVNQTNGHPQQQFFLAEIYVAQHKLAEAESLLKRMLQQPHDFNTAARIYGEAHLKLYHIYEDQDRKLEASKQINAAAPTLEAWLASESNQDPGARARARAVLIDCYKSQKKYDKAEQMLAKGLKFEQEMDYPADAIGFTIGEIAECRAQQDKFEEAEPYFLRAEKLSQSASAERLAELYTKIGINYFRQKKQSQAMKYLQKAEPLLKEWIQSDQDKVKNNGARPDVYIYYLLADNYEAQGRINDAEPVLRSAMQSVASSPAADEFQKKAVQDKLDHIQNQVREYSTKQ